MYCVVHQFLTYNTINIIFLAKNRIIRLERQHKYKFHTFIPQYARIESELYITQPALTTRMFIYLITLILQKFNIALFICMSL